MQQTTANQQDEPTGCAPVATPPQVEPLLPPKFASPFTDFDGLHRDVLPFYSERALRELIRKKIIPSIVLPGGRKRIFDRQAVESAIRRFSTTTTN